jgi:HSP20 family protein
MTLVRYFPNAFARPRWGREASFLPGRWLDEFLVEAPTGEWYPRADVVERDKHYEISIELPGIEKDNVKVSVENGLLTVSGQNEGEHEDQGKGYYRLERRYGAFSRSFDLPEGVDAEKIEAAYKNGILKLNVPKAPEVMPRKIEIKD